MNNQLHNQIKQLSDRELLEGIYQMLLVVMQEQLVSDSKQLGINVIADLLVDNMYRNRERNENNNNAPYIWCMEHGIVPPVHARRSVDGTMILLHEDFVAPVLGDEEISSYLYDSNELNEILNSEVWTEMN